MLLIKPAMRIYQERGYRIEAYGKVEKIKITEGYLFGYFYSTVSRHCSTNSLEYLILISIITLLSVGILYIVSRK